VSRNQHETRISLYFRPPEGIDSDKDLEDRKRLLYVALTRAKNHLILSWCKDKPRADSFAFLLFSAGLLDNAGSIADEKTIIELIQSDESGRPTENLVDEKKRLNPYELFQKNLKNIQTVAIPPILSPITIPTTIRLLPSALRHWNIAPVNTV